MVLLLLVGVAPTAAQDVVGERPYEMVWANRNEDDHPPLVDFENLDGWTVACENAEAKLERTREQQLFGQYVAKLTYRRAGTQGQPVVRLVPPQPVVIPQSSDAFQCWVYGNNWAWVQDPTTPQVALSAVFLDSEAKEFEVPLQTVYWEEWFLCHRRLTPEEIARVAKGGSLAAIVVRGGRNADDRVIYLDSFSVFTEKLEPLTFRPRPERGIAMFPGQGTGTNTGPGRLPFPIRPETILPDSAAKGSTTKLTEAGGAFEFTYSGSDGTLTYRLEPKTGTFGDLAARWEGRGAPLQPCADGGVALAVGGKPTPPDKLEPLGTAREGDTVVSKWRASAGDVSAEVTYAYRLWGKSLVIDVVAPGGQIAEVRYGRASGLDNPRLVTLPFYPMGAGQARPAVAVSGPPESPLFLMSNTCWYLSNASQPFAVNEIKDGLVAYNGGTRYITKTDGKRNDCYERLFVTVSPRFEEVLPTIPNPVSPWKEVTGTHLWRAHGAGNREADGRFWTECHRYGMTEVVITDHETGWRDGGESFTFRTKAAPKKGGDQGQYDYARLMQDQLGFVYGPYNNYTDFAPVNEFWSADLISRMPDNQLERAWARCYAPRPARAVEYCETLAPQIEAKFHFSTAYCDVHTAVAPWDRVDYDSRVPGAGTFAATFYAYGEIMLHQKAAWDGPVYSEGNNHAFYCGLTDGNYGQDQRYRPAVNPWLVDFDLRKIHDLCCNFGMGNPEMFLAGQPLGRTQEEIESSIDRFLAATVAFGHPGFLTYEGGLQHALRSYYMLQQLHSRYCLSSVEEIRYADGEGKLLDTSAAVATGAYARSQVVARYANGCVTVANGHPKERMAIEAYGRRVDLPPNGYAGWTPDGPIEVSSGDRAGRRADYSVSPAYLYADGRGRFVRFPSAACASVGICRILSGGKHEIIPYEGAEAGFAIGGATAVALDKEGKELGPAEVRVARGLTYAMPVEGAFSYRLTAAPAPDGELKCGRDTVVAGERVTVTGKGRHEVEIPPDAKPGDRLWREFEGAWVDFTVVPLAEPQVALAGDELRVSLTSNLPQPAKAQLWLQGRPHAVTLTPGEATATAINLGKPEGESVDVLSLELRAGDLKQTIETVVRTALGYRPLAKLPEAFQAGMALRGQPETNDFGETRGYAITSTMTSGDKTRGCIAMHPPYAGGTGYVFALYDAMQLPTGPPAFRALVGKGDGSDPGDGILYKLAVVDEAGKETVAGQQLVIKHEWTPIEADLSPWAGQSVRLKLISDVGEGDDSSGDWACWAEMRIETLQSVLTRELVADLERYRREPGPFPIAGLTVADLRAAKSGALHYDGLGLSGSGDKYASFAVVNGVELGNMAPAGGNEVEREWAAASVPLTGEAIRTLGPRNAFALRNPGQDWFAVRRFWVELELADGRKCSSDISAAEFTQPPNWPYGEGIGVPHGEDISTEIWFEAEE